MIRIKRSHDRQFYFTVESDNNGQTILQSETYTRKENLIKAARSLMSVFRCSIGIKVTDESNLQGKPVSYILEK